MIDDPTHEWSKFIGGESAFALLTMGLSRASSAGRAGLAGKCDAPVSGGKLGFDPAAKTWTSSAKGTPIILKDGFYEVGNMRISKNYYDRLWREGRPAPFLVAREILESGVKAVPDAIKTGFFRYEFGGWEMVYNPVTKEMWHLQPIR